MKKDNMEDEGEYLGNTNTRVYHLWSCHYRDVILERHQVATDGAGFRPCGVCKPGLSGLFEATRQADLFNYRERRCKDPRAGKIFDQTGCLKCGSHHGRVLMHPAQGGYKVKGESGRWWIYLECRECGYQSSIVKAQGRITRARVHRAAVKQEGK